MVTGAAGFIGYHLCRRLLDDGLEVVGLDSMVTGQPQNVADLKADAKFTWVQGDIIELPRIDGPLDVIYDMAFPASPADFETKAVYIMRTCSVGVDNLLKLAAEKGAVFVHASTSECYGDPQVNPQPETYWGHVNPIGLRSPYDEGKRFAEALVMSWHRREGAATRLVRIFNTYGPRMRADDGRALPNFITQALRGEPVTVYGDGTQTRSFCYVSDEVEGIVRLAASDFVEPVNVGTPEEITVLQAAREVIELCGSRSEILFRPLPKDDPVVRRPDITRARQVLGWDPVVERRDGFARTIEYFRGQAGA
jgi:dTDP-glucose 4,6-dehydratase